MDIEMEIATSSRIDTDLQRSAINWLREAKVNAFITYSFRKEVSFTAAEKIFGTYAYGLKSAFFGRNSTKRFPMVPIVEKYHQGDSYAALLTPEEGIHIHCFMQLPDYPCNHKETIRELWTKSDQRCGDPAVYCPKDDGWFVEIKTSDDQDRLINYALKTCQQNTDAVLWKFVSFGR
ncbi:hypothetical protein [Dyella kyungheensis]|uniref:Uncharacterized protein n=1 Tax=Dyella kyungheensis TaxID=1242174 RepID=A0ABS2JME4_9GAMM|nr:hypothetical protein [Dyella kyungheensis]MBM7120211.1 hypothetical protein [Dyella kyungheensis]